MFHTLAISIEGYEFVGAGEANSHSASSSSYTRTFTNIPTGQNPDVFAGVTGTESNERSWQYLQADSNMQNHFFISPADGFSIANWSTGGAFASSRQSVIVATNDYVCLNGTSGGPNPEYESRLTSYSDGASWRQATITVDDTDSDTEYENSFWFYLNALPSTGPVQPAAWYM